MAMKTRLAVVAIAGTLIAGIAAQAGAQGRGRGQAKPKPQEDVSVTVVFRDSDRVTFRDYFGTHNITAKALPPGIARNVARGKPLPPGIAKRAFPTGLVVLAPREPGVTFFIVGDRVVALRNGIVIDVLIDVFK
jgi:hypothetical protein